MELVNEAFSAIFIVGTLVLVNGFFVASEFALVSIRQSRVDELVSQGRTGAKAVKAAVKELDRYIAATQIGITIASLALGWVGEPVVAKILSPVLNLLIANPSYALIHNMSYVVSFALITFAHVVLGELLPKSIALQKPEATALLIGKPMSLFARLFQPLIFILNGCGNYCLRIIGFKPSAEYHAAHSMEELDILVQQSHQAGVLDDLEKEMLKRTIHFSELTAGAIKTPRTDIDALDYDKPIDELIKELSKSKHTRLPLYQGSIDNIIGIVHVQDVFHAFVNDQTLVDLKSIANPPFLVPESIGLDDLVTHLRGQETKLAIVVDEHGATAGLVTLRDIVEEVFGSVCKESDGLGGGFLKLDNGSIVIRGDFRLDELSRDLGWDISDDDVETLAGLLMKKLGRVAKVGDSFDFPKGRVKVTAMNKLRITKLLIEPKAQVINVLS